jgi:ATP-dependent exoDNAse (exonuclease V) alpha subunit
VFVGDFYQLRGVEPSRPTDSPRWARDVSRSTLRTMRRCHCEKLKKKLELLRTAKPSQAQLSEILRHHRAPKLRAPGDREEPSFEDIQQILVETPDTTFVSITKTGTEYLNQACVAALYPEQEPVAVVPGDPEALPSNFQGGQQVAWELPQVPIFVGMKLTLTKNVNKDMDFVNGMACTVLEVRQSGLRVQTSSGRYLCIYPYTEAWEDEWGQRHSFTYYPCRLGYATTLHKVQGATLAHLTLWLNCPNVEAAGYVALSRVQHDVDWRFVGQMTRHHFTPAAGV